MDFLSQIEDLETILFQYFLDQGRLGIFVHFCTLKGQNWHSASGYWRFSFKAFRGWVLSVFMIYVVSMV